MCLFIKFLSIHCQSAHLSVPMDSHDWYQNDKKRLYLAVFIMLIYVGVVISLIVHELLRIALFFMLNNLWYTNYKKYCEANKGG